MKMKMGSRHVSFKLEEAVEQVWQSMELSPDDRSARAAKLASNLNKTYQAFIL
jgi:predicted TPR repeat methyltransferase